MKRKGISLIVLIITILVIIILATAIIVNLAQTNIIENTNEAVLKSDIATLKQELDLYVSDEFVVNKGKYDRTKLNANDTIATYNTENIADKNSDGKADIYDILSSLKKSSLDRKVYIEEGKLIFRKSMFTSSQLNVLNKIGVEIDGIPKISNITSESEYTSIIVNVFVSDPTQVEKYIYELDDGQKIEHESNIATFEDLTIGTSYTLKITAVLKDGTQVTKTELLETKSIDGNIEFVKSETEPTANDVDVELVYENEIPDGYELQYRVTREENGEIVVITDWTAYTEKIIIDTNNTKVSARLYNSELEDEKLGTSSTISNIDKNPPATPVIEADCGYPIITYDGVKLNNNITIVYDIVNVKQNLYSIDGGDTWNEYTGAFSSLNIDTVTAKTIKLNGLESESTTAVSTPTNAMSELVYDGKDNTYMETRGRTYYMLIGKELHGGKINIKGYRSGTDSTIKILDSQNKVLYTTDPGYGKNYDIDIVVPEGAYKICSVGGDSYTKVKEISLVSISIFNFTGKIKPYVSAEKIGVRIPPVRIKYSAIATQRLYKINEEEWKEYNNELIELGANDILYAKTIIEDGAKSEVISTEKLKLATNEIGYNAYDGDETTFYLAGNKATRYIYVDSSSWGKELRILSKGYQIIYFKNDSGTTLYEKSGFRTTDNTYTIPEGTTYIQYYFNESGGIYEMMFVE